MVSEEKKENVLNEEQIHNAPSNRASVMRRTSWRTSMNQVIGSDGKANVSSTAVWERRTAEDVAAFEVYKSHFNEWDINNDGSLSMDEIYQIFEKEFFVDGHPKILSVIELITAFSGDNSGNLNLAEFATMMHYIQGSYAGDGQCCGDQIASAIETYKRSQQITSDRLEEKLGNINDILNMKDLEIKDGTTNKPNPMDPEFHSVYGPNQMRCLALVSHNGMKDTMKRFVIANKNVLKKFRLTGTNSTTTMLKSVFKGDEGVIYGPSCMSGPLGGDAELVAMLCKEQLGGVIFFEDPLDAHPHGGDIECLNRNIKIYNIMHACTTASATMMMHALRHGLENGKPELLPSFFKTLQCPSVEKYKKQQQAVIMSKVDAPKNGNN